MSERESFENEAANTSETEKPADSRLKKIAKAAILSGTLLLGGHGEKSVDVHEQVKNVSKQESIYKRDADIALQEAKKFVAEGMMGMAIGIIAGLSPKNASPGSAEEAKMYEPQLFSVLEEIAYTDPPAFVACYYKVSEAFPLEDIRPTLVKIIKNTPEIYTDMIYASGSNGYLIRDLADPALQHEPELFSIMKAGEELKLRDSEITAEISDYRLLVTKRILVRINDAKADAVGIAADDRKFFRFAIDKIQNPSTQGRASLENVIRTNALEVVREINSQHELRDEVRFASLKDFTPEEMYNLLVYGEEEVFTSTFNGIFTRLVTKMQQDHESGDDLLRKTHRNEFRTFLKLCARFNRLDEFLSTLPQKSQGRLLREFMTDIDQSRDYLSEAVAAADTIVSIENQDVLKILGEVIGAESEKKSNDVKARTIYGLLGAIFENKTHSQDPWFLKVAEQYKLPDLSSIKSAELLNQDGTDVQEYFFYEDEDGKNSFASFMARFMDKLDWKVEDEEDYVHIASVVKRGKPNKVEIFANKPGFESGNDKIEEILKQRNIQTLVVVHRGHSYHARETIRRIPGIAKIVYLGSCGGYKNLDAVLARAPKAHILSTKGTGTMLVNDPLLTMINSDIRSGSDINWAQFWQKAQRTLGGNPDFKNYIPPHENQGVLFIRAYQEITKGKV